MKRCPQCEFIYEDDQSFCDMDGIKLAHDSRPLPRLQALSTSEGTPKTTWKGRVVPVFASAMLVIVLGLVYVVSTRLTSQSNSDAASTTIETPASNPIESPAPSVVPDTANEASKEPPHDLSPAGSQPRKSVETPSEKPDVKPKSKPAQVQNSHRGTPEDKDDSKMRSMLKKTKRFFKKALPL